MFGIGITEIILILIVALVIIGPEKLPELAKTIGKTFNEFKRTSNDIKRTFDLESNEPPVKSSKESESFRPPDKDNGEDEDFEEIEKPKRKTRPIKSVKPKVEGRRKPAKKNVKASAKKSSKNSPENSNGGGES
ncbi:MAG: twin-arginine translocase TatA/TatE family subunit [Thermodesulfobacteriota bacterium]